MSVQVAQDGRKINDSRRNERSVAVTEELERIKNDPVLCGIFLYLSLIHI